MMKKTMSVLTMICFSVIYCYSQAVLPTSWSFTTSNLPSGWSTTGTTFYTGSGNTAPAMKFDTSNDDLTIFFADEPGNLTYYIAGNSFSGGTFTVQESTNGSSWTTLHSFTSFAVDQAYSLITDVPNPNSRYIRFFYTNKSAGNVGLDDVMIAAPTATPAQEMNVKFNGSTIPNNGSILVSSSLNVNLPITFSIENLGTANALTISGATLSGANSSDYSVGSTPSSIAANGAQNLVVNFTPTANGSRIGIVTITNNDANENPYVITINGTGGNYATEPTQQPTNLLFTNVKTYRLNASYTTASNVDGFIVLRRNGAAITDVPVDGETYQRGDQIGNSKVVYVGTGNSFVPNNIVANTNYYFSVFSYNGSGSTTNYLTTNPLSNNVTTPETMLSNTEYNSINTASSTFLTDLHDLISPHNSYYYSSYAQWMVSKFAARDTVDNQRVLTCVYSGENVVFSEPFSWSSTGFSREHTYCHNWMPTNPADSPERPEYNDFHHLFPTNQNDVNSLRSNYPLGEVVTPTSTYLQGKLGLDANGKTVFEPRDEHKGDAARAIMYMAVCYNGIDGFNWKLRNPISNTINYGQDQEVLKQWHFQDPPSNWEIARNDFIDSLQGNRNPFIDSMSFACYIDFTQMTYKSIGCDAGLTIEADLENRFSVYPVPSKDLMFIQVNGTEISQYKVIDLQGSVILSEDNKDCQVVTIHSEKLNVGTYFIEVITPYGVVTKKVVKE